MKNIGVWCCCVLLVLVVCNTAFVVETSAKNRFKQQQDDTTLENTLTLFRNVIAELIEPTSAQVQGRTVTASSLAAQMREEIEHPHKGKGGGGGVSSWHSMPPLWVAGMSWQQDLEAVVAEFCGLLGQPDRSGVIVVLRRLSECGFRPQDGHVLQVFTGQLRELVNRAKKLLDTPLFTVKGACPACGQSFVLLPDSLGDLVRHDVLTVRTEIADCAYCGTVWEGADMVTLATQVTNS